jgi:hypothetical protein
MKFRTIPRPRALFFMLCDHGGLFFAGDPAQAVLRCFEFRFEDACGYFSFVPTTNGTFKKTFDCKREFPKSYGVLNAASAVLDLLSRHSL